MTNRRPYEAPTLTALSEDELIAEIERMDLATVPIPPSAHECVEEIMWLWIVWSVLRRGDQLGLMTKVQVRIQALERDL